MKVKFRFLYARLRPAAVVLLVFALLATACGLDPAATPTPVGGTPGRDVCWGVALRRLDLYRTVGNRASGMISRGTPLFVYLDLDGTRYIADRGVLWAFIDRYYDGRSFGFSGWAVIYDGATGYVGFQDLRCAEEALGKLGIHGISFAEATPKPPFSRSSAPPISQRVPSGCAIVCMSDAGWTVDDIGPAEGVYINAVADRHIQEYNAIDGETELAIVPAGATLEIVPQFKYVEPWAWGAVRYGVVVGWARMGLLSADGEPAYWTIKVFNVWGLDTPTPETTPPPTWTPTPTDTPTPRPPTCVGIVRAGRDFVNVREAPWGTIIGRVYAGDDFWVIGAVQDDAGMYWAHALNPDWEPESDLWQFGYVAYWVIRDNRVERCPAIE